MRPMFNRSRLDEPFNHVGLCVMAAILMLPDGARADSHGGGGWEWLASLPGLIAALVGVAALITAIFGVRATLKTLRHKQYETASNMLQAVDQERGPGYVSRTAAVAFLAQLASRYPKDYDEPVMRTFEAFLCFPPRYGKNARKEGQVDYTSRDTVAIVETINKRHPKQREAYRISLPPHRPFRVTEGGDVEPNPDYDDPYARCEGAPDDG
ncbi:MAG: hypothetical protein OXK82_08035 [Deltaproteobacteria bacterium]|nr:hypothetical protein [Deltaproteobacteria bacterium]